MSTGPRRAAIFAKANRTASASTISTTAASILVPKALDKSRHRPVAVESGDRGALAAEIPAELLTDTAGSTRDGDDLVLKLPNLRTRPVRLQYRD
jgi:hypothetical protein